MTKLSNFLKPFLNYHVYILTGWPGSTFAVQMNHNYKNINIVYYKNSINSEQISFLIKKIINEV